MDTGPLLDLVWKYLPRDVKSQGEFDDPELSIQGMAARAATAVEAICQMDLPRQIVESEDILRSLIDTSITIAWIAADPAPRMKSWVQYEWGQRLKMDNALQTLANDPTYSAYVTQHGKPSRQMSPTTTAEAEKWKADTSISGLPTLTDRAKAADQRWMNEVDVLRQQPFAYWYDLVYRRMSSMSHPTVQTLFRYIDGMPPNLRVGVPGTNAGKTNNCNVALAMLVVVLNIVSELYGWPDKTEIREAQAKAAASLHGRHVPPW